MNLTEFEQSLISKIIEGDEEEDILRQQLTSVKVTDKVRAGNGAFVIICVSEKIPPAKKYNRWIKNTPMARLHHPRWSEGGHAFLRFDNGFMKELEYVTSREDWPADESLCSIQPYRLSWPGVLEKVALPTRGIEYSSPGTRV